MNFLNITQQNNVLSIVLNRVDVHNAFNEQMLRELKEAFISADQNAAVRAIVLKANGKSFCAGADLSYMQQLVADSHENNVAQAKLLHEMYLSVYECSKPVIAVVHGSALGGGLGLLAVCDYVYAAPHLEFSFSEVRLGIVPAVISPFVIRKIGPAAAKKLFISGEKFGAEKARSIGLVDDVAPGERINEMAMRKIAEILQAAPGAVGLAKKLVDDIAGLTPAECAPITTELIAKCRVGGEGQEGMKAFLEKRKPSWI